eukprot:Colp12_sorted_trinity150504_noHs@34718
MEKPLQRRRSNVLRGDSLKEHKQILRQVTSQASLMASPIIEITLRGPDFISNKELQAEVVSLGQQYLEKYRKNAPDGESLPTCHEVEVITKVLQRLLSSDLSSCVKRVEDDAILYSGHELAQLVSTEMSVEVGKWKTQPAIERAQRYYVDHHAEQGRRPTMEDEHTIVEDLNSLLKLEGYPPQAFFAVYDGHGGREAAEYAQAHLHFNIAKQESFSTDVTQALVAGFLETDAAFLARATRQDVSGGATCVTALLRGNNLYISWLGDSQAMLCKGGEAIDLLCPHKPEREDEKRRIEEAGGVVVWYGTWRVNGVLSVARAIGDRHLKSLVIGRPDVAHFELEGDEQYMVLACDGLWDVMSSQDVVQFVAGYMMRSGTGQGVSQALVQHALSLGSCDNISVVVVFLKPPHGPSTPAAEPGPGELASGVEVVVQAPGHQGPTMSSSPPAISPLAAWHDGDPPAAN